MQRVNIVDLPLKEEVRSSFFVKHMDLMEAKDGRPYLNMILADSTGDLETKVWNDAQELAGQISKGDFVSVSGKLNMYRGKKQFIIMECLKLDPKDINKNDFIVKAQREPEAMFTDLVMLVDRLDDVYIRELLTLVLQDQEVARRLKMWQAGKTIHHAYQSGLLEHILSCTQLAFDLSAHYKVNKNYVVAGAILHDLCKIYELTDGMNIDYTEEGKLVGHLVKGVEVVDKYAYRIKGFPHQTRLHLKHVLLSHHGQYEYGSPKLPQTSEAMLLHLIDMMDSKMHAFETIKRTDQNVGRWSGFVRHLDRIIYKEELPFYPEYEAQERQAAPSGNSKGPNSNERPKKQPKKHEKEVKQNLGDLLKDFKLEKS